MISTVFECKKESVKGQRSKDKFKDDNANGNRSNLKGRRPVHPSNSNHDTFILKCAVLYVGCKTCTYEHY